MVQANDTHGQIGLVGYGYWGPNLLRNLLQAGGKCAGIVDTSATARAQAQKLYPHLSVYEDLSTFLEKEKPLGVMIATPPATHLPIALQCLRAGAHILVEKPLALSSVECMQINKEAEKLKRIVMVDHTFVYHPVIEHLAQISAAGQLGKLMYYDSVRVNFAGYQPATNVLWDLAPHDLSILDHILKGQLPLSVSAMGVTHYSADHTNQCYMHLQYPEQFIAHLHLNWTAPVKIRLITLGGSRKMALYDDNLPTEKLRIYDRELSVACNDTSDFRANYRSGDMIAPALPSREALGGAVKDFLYSISEKALPRSDGGLASRVVRIMEAAEASLKQNGTPIFL